MAAKSTKNKSTTKSEGARPAKSGNSKKNVPLAKQLIKDLRYGQSLSLEFFSYNAWILVILLVAVLSLIGLRYKTKTKMSEIKRLSHQLELAQSDKMREQAAYMSLVRETEMRRLVAEKNLGLIFQEQPPYDVELIDDGRIPTLSYPARRGHKPEARTNPIALRSPSPRRRAEGASPKPARIPSIPKAQNYILNQQH